ncbi:MAG: type II toxin-antitoxin system HicA family toxin [Candidatus Cloacimonetes bacterium]|nr:type II toxin-antitoxin system HicA family toxin [Candidatus Cloacimonadota bacterium]
MPLSGKEMLALYEKQNWVVLRKKGSHVIVGKRKLRQTIPMHKELKKGMERKLFKTLKEGD